MKRDPPDLASSPPFYGRLHEAEFHFLVVPTQWARPTRHQGSSRALRQLPPFHDAIDDIGRDELKSRQPNEMRSTRGLDIHRWIHRFCGGSGPSRRNVAA